MALILNIETSTTNCSVSLSKDEEILVLKEDNNAGYSHAEKLHLFIKDVIDTTGTSKANIDAIAISKGPGSYTGLRIGVSAAKGLCFSLDKPLISVFTLEALAYQVKSPKGMIIPMLDARRMEVYSAIFNSDYSLQRKVKAEVLDSGSFNSELEKGQVYFIGSGVEKTKTLINNSNAIFIENKLPSAATMSKIANAKYKISDFEDVAYFEPYYLKDFVAIKSKKI
ncbi:MAG: tRNA (adenosine(37)-N6)-threonylcarbamoyltransferase complex dimerization subunit type 1 TsaB [Winogradskyella sp.]|uniref:tRNA (adenosine(37)-N6)-threonylcarbamoyltransferase complex dimerization subunit type 1 TsaB n=1 Tax=Winogradskyella sp. TaxID=1883156 RepID=UPI0018085E08|nr:tRNA (adenosine(37)-N6)-threonylcarbamoyltransferase complex dimerization subunit type 1 TsaB [Winogradskyella sp.]MBT8245003.1 tRNA (adenosine(37)-N6)-threonylcarbamoyltransferase complex dimerization subunit type 1 TsaB [Winogradskyella sp.]NNK22155.1 tRNA (adenosine(37)-N6)-threonylcarbamoyltransferase complex dimerization subunit type 1 TsaB [Winogradskyella sp.]